MSISRPRARQTPWPGFYETSKTHFLTLSCRSPLFDFPALAQTAQMAQFNAIENAQKRRFYVKNALRSPGKMTKWYYILLYSLTLYIALAC